MIIYEDPFVVDLSRHPPSPPRTLSTYLQEVLSCLCSEHGTPASVWRHLHPQIERSFETCGQVSEADLGIIAFFPQGEPTEHQRAEICARYHLLERVFESALSDEDENGVKYRDVH